MPDRHRKPGRAGVPGRSAVAAALALGAVCALVPALGAGQGLGLSDANLQKRANALLALMGYMLTPDAKNPTLTPIFNFSYGRVDSNVSAAGQTETGVEFDFLHNGRLDAYGLGGSLLLDYERYRPENAIDLELRYTKFTCRALAAARGR